MCRWWNPSTLRPSATRPDPSLQHSAALPAQMQAVITFADIRVLDQEQGQVEHRRAHNSRKLGGIGEETDDRGYNELNELVQHVNCIDWRWLLKREVN